MIEVLQNKSYINKSIVGEKVSLRLPSHEPFHVARFRIQWSSIKQAARPQWVEGLIELLDF